MHAVNQPFFHLEQEPVVARQMEHQAWNFAYELLMPTDALVDMLRHRWNAADLREQFEVSEDFFQKRMEVFKEARTIAALALGKMFTPRTINI